MDIDTLLHLALTQDLPNQLAAAVFLLALYPFVSKEYKESYLLIAALPAFVGSLFPDLSYIIFLFIFRLNLYNSMHNPTVHIALFPIAQLTVCLTAKLFKKKLPDNWFIFAGLMAVGMAWMHLVVDAFGF